MVAVFGLGVVIATIATIVYALARGGKTERLGAGVYAGCILLTWGAQLSIQHAPLYALLMIDTALAVSFGVLAVKNPEKLWPGVAGVGQTLVVVFSATRALSFPMSEFAYLTMLNLASVLVFAPIAAGTWNHRRQGVARPAGALAPA